MSATCAACGQPLTRGDKFVLSGAEVFHSACASRVGESRAWRTKRDLQRLTAENQNLRAVLAERSRELNDLKNRDLPALRRERDEAREDVIAANTTARSVQQLRQIDARRRAEIEIERDAAQAERDAARRDLAVARAAVVAEPAVRREVDERSPIEQRFSLLEIDDP